MSVIPDPYLFLELADHLVADLVHVPDYAVVAVVEDGGVRVLIDGDELARVDAGDVVHRARDAEADIELGLYHDAGLADLKLIWLSQRELDLEQLLDTVSSYDKSTGLLYFSWHKPQQMPSHSFLADNIGKTLTGFANSPLFTLKDLHPQDGYFGGGYYVSASDYATDCMRIIDEIREGKPASDIPPDAGQSTPENYFNYLDLQWFNISPQLCPDQIHLYNEPVSFYEKYWKKHSWTHSHSTGYLRHASLLLPYRQEAQEHE